MRRYKCKTSHNNIRRKQAHVWRERDEERCVQENSRTVHQDICSWGHWRTVHEKVGKDNTKTKEIEDQNNKSGNDKKTWKLYDELCGCPAKDHTVSPAF